jgi:hypothetical protein
MLGVGTARLGRGGVRHRIGKFELWPVLGYC